MEAELLRVDSHMSGRRSSDEFETDAKSLNTIFRAVHSIKGGSSTFGFEAVAGFSHTLESLLDKLRDGQCHKTRELISTLLQSCDGLRTLIQNAQNKINTLPENIYKIQKKLEGLLASDGVVSPERRRKTRSVDTTGKGAPGWNISFAPNQEILATGNDPVRIIRALANIGNIKSEMHIDQLPSWKLLDPEKVYLSWDIECLQKVDKNEIENIFSWVVDDCKLDISARIDKAKGESSEKDILHSSTTMHSLLLDTPGGSAVQSIRVSTPKIDALVDLVGELVITQTMLSQFQEEITPESITKLQAGLSLLERNTRDLQESVMGIRMLPVGFALNKLPRIVHDVCLKLDKNVRLEISGEGTELDKSVIESIGDALMHIVRNSVDHGIEEKSARIAAGKPETGTISVNASQKGGNVVIVIEDDGAGLDRDLILKKAIEKNLIGQNDALTDEQIDALIFHPGFSTASRITGISGRGVGMDVVRTRIGDLGGSVDVESSTGTGTKFTLRLPLTLAIMDGLCVKVGEQIYIIPLLSVIESLSIPNDKVVRPAGGSELIPFHNEHLPFLRLYELFNINSEKREISDGIIIVIETENKKIGLLVDEIVGQQQVVVKSLETHYKRVDGVATATILGDGEVALILDISTLTNLLRFRDQGNRKLKVAS